MRDAYMHRACQQASPIAPIARAGCAPFSRAPTWIEHEPSHRRTSAVASSQSCRCRHHLVLQPVRRRLSR